MRLPSSLIARPRLPSVGARNFTTSLKSLQPTALHRAQREADLKAHPESSLTQEKLPDKGHNRHWSEEKATASEADIHADHVAREEEAKQGQQNQKAQSSEPSR